MTANPFEYRTRINIAFGPGKSGDLPVYLSQLTDRVGRAVIVTDPGVRAAGLVDGPVAGLERAGWAVEVFDRIGGDPKIDQIDQAAEAIRRFDPQAVIGLGGGSALDAAKLAAAASGREDGCRCYACAATDPPTRTLALVAVPTIAGTGAEATRTVVMSDSDGRKLWAWGQPLVPDLALLDPELTVGLPSKLTAAAGLDALVHAVEAATVRRSDPLSRAYGREAIRLAAPALTALAADPRNLDARGDLMIAAALAGLAIDQAGTGLAHAIGHALGGLAGIHHGAACALAEQVVLPFNAAQAAEAHAGIIRDLGGPAGRPDLAWKNLLAPAGLDNSLIRAKLNPADRDRIVEACLAPENKPMIDNNLRQVDRDQLGRLIDQLLADI